MITLWRKFLRAFLYDELAVKRWARAGAASLALALVTVIPFTGTDVTQAALLVKSWTVGDWAIRIGLGFLFSSVHREAK